MRSPYESSPLLRYATRLVAVDDGDRRETALKIEIRHVEQRIVRDRILRRGSAAIQSRTSSSEEADVPSIAVSLPETATKSTRPRYFR